MRLFLDASVLLAACGSAKGASRELFRLAQGRSWKLVTIPYVLEEVGRNLAAFPHGASADWVRLRRFLVIEDNVLSLDRPAIFAAGKDRPVLFSALAWADVLLTLDSRDFGDLLGGTFYGLPVLRPGAFLERERATGRL